MNDMMNSQELRIYLKMLHIAYKQDQENKANDPDNYEEN
jgi:hypothetical protein